MSRHPALDIADRDPVELRDERPTRSEIDDVEPADFDDRRIAERFGPQAGGHFAHEVDDFGMEDW
jgi:hypothetical protein